ncbi:MAG: ParB/RepB/Spo0J family partition protein [Phenylobacterium sp.]|uniref:ParB/RepB/Spo0J family partition protein n=1 Tax=Phenylobacterium sp. TaxID=1871053 RepID=UPI00391BD9B2
MSDPVPTPAPEARLPLTVPLRDLAVAPENLRFGEPPDDGIPQLAETILAAGLLQPLTVRPGRRREARWMVLDGRRRWLALTALLADGRIAEDFGVSAFVENDRARQAAAVVLTNTGVPVHVADVIAAIGRMLKAKLTVEAVAAALGYEEVEVRRLAALAGLHPKALEALKAGRVSLRQARLLARLPDRKEQGELAQATLDGYAFPEWRITDRLERGRLTAADRRFRLAGAARYAAAGGRIESDLFGEHPDVLLDPAALEAAWSGRAEALADAVAAPGREVQVASIAGEPDETLEPFGPAYGDGLDAEALDAEALDAWRAAEAAAAEAAAALADRDLSDASCDGAIRAFLEARLAALVASERARDASLVQVFASGRTGLDLRAYGPPPEVVEVEAHETQREAADDGPALSLSTTFARPGAGSLAPVRCVAAAPPPELEGVNHALHEVRTDTATRALVRALADDPGTALVAIVARLFAVMVLRQGLGKGGGALTVGAEAYSRPRTPPIASLDGEVRQRLADRRVAWEASGLSPIGWVASLAHGERMALLAELAGLSLDLREERTSLLRRAARAEAVEIAALCGADVTLHWTPDAPFLAAHPKGKLLAMLDEMGGPDGRAGGCRKDELVALVAERAAERAWAPAYLSWAAALPEEPEPQPDEAGALTRDGASHDEAPDDEAAAVAA